MSSICSSNLTSGFVDLATYDELEKYMYGGETAITYFVRRVVKSSWFTQVPVCLSRASGSAEFNQQWSAAITRSGDVLLQAWLRVTIPSVQLSASNTFGADGRLRWTRNLMHNLIRECAITFNDLTAQQFNNYHLDFWAAFTVPAGKQNGYQNMIGNTDDLIQPHSSAQAIPSATLNLPLPFFFARDYGLGLPTAAIPYNDMRITFVFRHWNQLLILDDLGAAAGTNPSIQPTASDLVGGAPVLTAANVWANYAIVANEEREKMGCAGRDMLIEQVQTAPIQTYNPGQVRQPQYDIRFSHAVKGLFWAVRNKTTESEWSNYTAASPVPGATLVDFFPSGAVDPIQTTSIIYENTQRLYQMGSDYFSLVQPYYHMPVIPNVTGYHAYSYALDFISPDPTGSTNFGKITNVSIIPYASQGAVDGSLADGAAGSGADYAQAYEFIVTAVNYTIIRVSGGTLGFPVL